MWTSKGPTSSTALAAVLALLCGSAGLAMAQDQTGAAQPAPPMNDQSAPSAPAPGDGQGSASPPAKPGSLSDELSRSQGVVKPPPIDPEMTQPAPSAGPQSTPVIPPPGSPGGNQDVQPK